MESNEDPADERDELILALRTELLDLRQRATEELTHALTAREESKRALDDLIAKWGEFRKKYEELLEAIRPLGQVATALQLTRYEIEDDLICSIGIWIRATEQDEASFYPLIRYSAGYFRKVRDIIDSARKEAS